MILFTVHKDIKSYTTIQHFPVLKYSQFLGLEKANKVR